MTSLFCRVQTHHVLDQPVVHIHHVLGNVRHHRNQTLCCVVHVVLQRHILRGGAHTVTF